MDYAYWHKQTIDKPLYPDLVWSRPQNRQTAGKLLIVGGNAHSFAAVGEAFNESTNAGIGTIRVIMPDKLSKVVGKLFPSAEFAPSTPSGSFSRQAVAPILDASIWADALLFSGDMGRNAETAIMLETMLLKYSGISIFTQDSVDYISTTPQAAINRDDTMLVLSLSQLQRLVISLKYPSAITFNMDLSRLVEWLHIFTERYKLKLIVEHLEVFLVASNGQVSTTKIIDSERIWRIKTASHAAVWWLQNRQKVFEAATCAVAKFELN